MASALDMYMENLDEFINDENKVVTYRWLSLTLKLPCDAAKRLLSHYVSTHKASETLHVTYLVIGQDKTEDDVPGTKVCVVPQSRLEKTKQSLSSVSCVHVYSVSKSQLPDMVGALYTADYDSIRQNLSQSTNTSSCDVDKLRAYHLQANVATLNPENPEKYGGITCSSSAQCSQEDIDSSRSNGTYLPSTPQDTRNAPDPRLSRTSQSSPSKAAGTGKASCNEKNKPSAKGSLVSMFAAQKTVKKDVKPEPDNEEKVKKTTSGKVAASTAKKQNGISNFLKSGVDPRESEPKVPVRVTRSSPRKAQVKDEDDAPIEDSPKKPSPKKSPPKKTYGRAKGKARPATQSNRTRILKIDSDSSDEDVATRVSDDDDEEPIPPSPSPAEAMSDEESPKPVPEPVAKPSRGMKRKTVDRTFDMGNGYLMTKKEEVDVTDSESEEVPSPPPKKPDRTASPVKAAVEKPNKDVKKQTQAKKTSPAKNKQASIMSFFKKKESV